MQGTKNISSQKILFMEDFIQYIKNDITNLPFIIILRHDNEGSIIPTLSICLKNNNIRIFSSIEEIYLALSIDSQEKNSIIHLEKKIESLFEVTKISHTTIITDKSITIDNNLSTDKVKSIEKYHTLISKQSLNKSNESYKIRKKVREGINKLLTEDITIFVDKICQYFSNEYAINFYAMEYIEKENDPWQCIKECPMHIKNICNEVEKKVTKEKVPIAIKKGEVYYIIFPFISDLTDNYLKDIIVISSNEHIPRYILDNLRHIVNYYFAVYLKEKKQEIFDEITHQTKQLDSFIQEEISKNELFSIEKILQREWITKIFHRITSVSNAHSISLRLFYPEDKMLKRVCEHSNEYIELLEKPFMNLENFKWSSIQISGIFPYKISFYENKINLDIALHSDRTSQVARTFKENREFYTAYVASGDRKHIKFRKNTKCEYSLLIKNKTKTIGILNVESLIINGLSNEKYFFQKLVQYINYYIEQAYGFNDLYWLTRRGNVYQNYHEIENIIRESNFPHTYRDKIQSYLTMQPINSSHKLAKFFELELLRKSFLNKTRDSFNQMLASFRKEKKYEILKDGCIYNLNEESLIIEEIPQYKMDILKIIYTNLLNNYNKHALKGQDSLSVFQSQDKYDNVYINFNIQTYKPNAFRHKSIFESPLDLGKKRTHYGLFIIGRLTRHLNGTIDLKYDKKKSKTIVLISIPIGE